MYVDSTGLPRPLPPWRGAAWHADSRHLVLRRFVGLDVEALPPSVQELLDRPTRGLTDNERRRLARALVAQGLDARGLGLVLNVIGDGPVSARVLAEMVRQAQLERERATRETENFSVLGISERAGSRGPYKNTTRFVLRVRLDEDGREIVLDVGVNDLATYRRFRVACLKQARFVPLFRESRGGRGNAWYFDHWVEAVLTPLRQGPG